LTYFNIIAAQVYKHVNHQMIQEAQKNVTDKPLG